MTMLTQDINKKTQVKAPKVPMPPFRVQTDARGDRVLHDIHKDLVTILKDLIRTDTLYDQKPTLSLDYLFTEITMLRNEIPNYKSQKLKQLVKFLEQEYADALAQAQRMNAKGMVSFGSLHLLFGVGAHVVLPGDHAQGARVTECSYRESPWGRYLTLEVEYVSSTGREFCMRIRDVVVEGFSGVRPIQELPIQLITPEHKQQLHMRGELYAKVALGAHHMHLTGHMLTRKWWQMTRMRATGRCMVDIQTHDQFTDSARANRRHEHATQLQSDQFWMTDAHVQGFSFVTKQWGKFPVSALSPVQFRSAAYDQLVLDPDKKDMIRALVQHHEGNFEDIISGKGGGCIFLLHGEPGVGKTLTAEAVSELLQRPLYSVGVGELGTDPASMEKNLRQILDVAQIWNAVILLDEADIFLEARSKGDILRNACVGVLLKLCEYHQGVMFLTTNRVEDFDPAFYSRISVALRYGTLTTSAREQIWRNLLSAAQIDQVPHVQGLAQHELNGRQIKNIIRLSHSLSQQRGTPVTLELIESCVQLNQQFMKGSLTNEHMC